MWPQVKMNFTFICLPGWSILSPLSTDSTPRFKRLLKGLPQLIYRNQRNIDIMVKLKVKSVLECFAPGMLFFTAIMLYGGWKLKTSSQWSDSLEAFDGLKLVPCRRELVTCHRVMEAASVWWWSSEHSGCELRLCDGSWGPQNQGPVLSVAWPPQEAALNKFLL